MNDSFPELKIEHLTDGMGDGLILLEQNSSGNIDRVAIHPVQLRYMAEKMGLVESSDPQAQKTIATLTRRLHVLRDRIGFLADWMAKHSDHKHADLSFELTHLDTMADLAHEFCEDFPGAEEPMQAVSIMHPIHDDQAPAPKQAAQLDLAGV